MRYKKSFITLCLLFLGTLSSIYSQEKASDAYMELPATAMQYRDAVTITVHYKPSFDGDVDSFQWIDPWGAFLDISSSTGKDVNGYTTVSRTIIFLISGNVTISTNKVSKSITVTSNPLELSVPSHICPGGTQLSCSAIVSPLLTKSYSVSGNSTAKISDTGLLTYDSKESGSANVKISLLYGNNVVKTTDKVVSLDTRHIPTGHYSFEYNGAPYSRNLSKNNPVDWGSSVTAVFYLEGMKNCSAKLLTLDAAINFQHSAYGDRSEVIFKPVGNEGEIVTIRLTYNMPGCPNLVTYDCNFIIEGSYSVAYSSNVLTIKKQIVQKNRSLSTNVDQYMLIDALTGNLVKRGQLTQDVTDINISGTPKGIYIVKIISKNNTKSYKISVN